MMPQNSAAVEGRCAQYVLCSHLDDFPKVFWSRAASPLSSITSLASSAPADCPLCRSGTA
jgi:hypothetical protein